MRTKINQSILISRSFMDIAYKNPVVRPYKSVDDLRTLKKWFYEFDSKNDKRQRAIQRVKALVSRGKMPHGVEATSLLTLAILADEGGSETNVTQLTYTAAFIRFVNGLLDPLQLGHFVIPLVALAQQLGLPFFFVELRHMGTHDLLPTLAMCRLALKKALGWLFDNYWNQIDEEEIEYEEYEVVKFQKRVVYDDVVEQINLKLEPIIGSLKQYKKLRKQDMDIVGTKFFKIFKNLRTFSNLKEKWYHNELQHLTSQDLLLNVLLYKNFLIYNHVKVSKQESFKFNPTWIKLYQPLLDEMGLKFKLNLTLKIFQQIKTFGKSNVGVLSKLGFVLVNPKEVAQLLEWLNFLIPDVLEEFSLAPSQLYLNMNPQYIKISAVNGGTVVRTKDDLFQYTMAELSQLYNITCKNGSTSEAYLKVVTTCNGEDLNGKLRGIIESLLIKAKYVADFQKNFVAPPTLDDILGECNVEPVKKKMKGDGYLFERHENWEAVPFGVPI